MLLLNASYEPLTICNVKKAFILVFLGKAEIVVDKGTKRLRSVTDSFPFPSVIRLVTYVRVPYNNIILSRKNIIRRDGNKCAYCGKKETNLTIDHIIPKARGGQDQWENLVASCVRCNNQKGDRTPEEAGMKLNVRPYKPNYIMFLKNSVGTVESSWKQFLFEV